jgi:MFS family permease
LGLLSLVLVGVAISGTACYGFTYLGGLAEVVGLGGNHAAWVTSGYFACAYLGYGISVIFIGFLSDRFGVVHTLVGFEIILLMSNAMPVIKRHKDFLARCRFEEFPFD